MILVIALSQCSESQKGVSFPNSSQVSLLRYFLSVLVWWLGLPTWPVFGEVVSSKNKPLSKPSIPHQVKLKEYIYIQYILLQQDLQEGNLTIITSTTHFYQRHRRHKPPIITDIIVTWEWDFATAEMFFRRVGDHVIRKTSRRSFQQTFTLCLLRENPATWHSQEPQSPSFSDCGCVIAGLCHPFCIHSWWLCSDPPTIDTCTASSFRISTPTVAGFGVAINTERSYPASFARSVFEFGRGCFSSVFGIEISL